MTNPLEHHPTPSASAHAQWRAQFGVSDVLLLMVAAVWGGSYAVTKQVTLLWPVLDFLTLRFGLTCLVLLPALRLLFTPKGRGGLAVGGILGVNLLAIFVCETYGVTLTSAANAALLISLCVALTPLTEWLLLGQAPSMLTWRAVVLSVLGAVLLTSTAGFGRPGLGDVLILLAALLRAIMVTQTRRLATCHTLPALTLTALQSAVVTLGLLALTIILHGPHWPALPRQMSFWGGMMFLVLLCTIFAFFAQNYAAARTSPSRVSLLMGSEPVFGALFAVLWLGERMTLLGWVGGALMVLAAWYATRRPAVVGA